MRFMTTIITMLLASYTNAAVPALVDCNKASSIAAVGVLYIYQGTPTASVLKTLPEASQKAGLNEAELIVATGIIANVASGDVKQLYVDMGLTKETKERKLQATRDVFYMFCKQAFEPKNYY